MIHTKKCKKCKELFDIATNFDWCPGCRNKRGFVLIKGERVGMSEKKEVIYILKDLIKPLQGCLALGFSIGILCTLGEFIDGNKVPALLEFIKISLIAFVIIFLIISIISFSCGMMIHILMGHKVKFKLNKKEVEK